MFKTLTGEGENAKYDIIGWIGFHLEGYELGIGELVFDLRSVEGRYQAQLVQDKARQIELYGQRYRDVVAGLARAFEISGGIQTLNDTGYDSRLQKTLEEDPNLIGLAIWPVSGELHRAFQPEREILASGGSRRLRSGEQS